MDLVGLLESNPSRATSRPGIVGERSPSSPFLRPALSNIKPILNFSKATRMVLLIAKSKSHTRRAVESQDSSEGGHDLWLFTPDWKTWPSASGKEHGRQGNLWTCRTCLRVSTRSDFHNQCKGRPGRVGKCPGAQKGFWHRLQNSHGNRDKLLQIWNLRQSSADSLLGSGAFQAPESRLATAGRDKTRHLPGVKTEAGSKKNEASNPGPSSSPPASRARLSVVSWNSGGAPGLWRLREEAFLGADVLCVQETKANASDRLAFTKCCKQAGYLAYWAPDIPTVGRWQASRERGGLLLLVSKRCKQKLVDVRTGENSQVLVAHVEGTCVLGVYS